jgi:hypothetical protein
VLNDFENALLKELANMQKEREAQNITPTHLLYVDVKNRLNSALNALYEEKKIKVGKTINDKYISVEKWLN